MTYLQVGVNYSKQAVAALMAPELHSSVDFEADTSVAQNAIKLCRHAHQHAHAAGRLHGLQASKHTQSGIKDAPGDGKKSACDEAHDIWTLAAHLAAYKRAQKVLDAQCAKLLLPSIGHRLGRGDRHAGQAKEAASSTRQGVSNDLDTTSACDCAGNTRTFHMSDGASDMAAWQAVALLRGSLPLSVGHGLCEGMLGSLSEPWCDASGV